MAHISQNLTGAAWIDTGLTGPVTFWVPGGTFLFSTGAVLPTSDDNARFIDANDPNGETIDYTGTDKVWIKRLSGMNRLVVET